MKNILCILHNYRQIICFCILSDNLYIVYILSDNYLRHRQGDFLGKSSIFIKFPAKVCEICFGIPFFLYKGLGFLIRRFLFLEIKRFLFLSIKKEVSFKKAEGELMSVGTVGNLVFSYPQFPWTARGRCLLGAKRVLCSLKIDSGSIYFSWDVIVPSNTEHK